MMYACKNRSATRFKEDLEATRYHLVVVVRNTKKEIKSFRPVHLGDEMHCLSRMPQSYLLNSYSDVKELDEAKKESFEATWLDLVMETRPEYKITLAEKDSSRKETYERKQVAHFVVRRFPNQILWTGQDGAKMREYHLPYTKSVLPIPIFVPRDLTSVDETKREPSPAFLQSIMDFEKNENERKQPMSIMKDMPRAVESSSPEFRASRLISPLSDVQRRE